jgi:hypothetical protein
MCQPIGLQMHEWDKTKIHFVHFRYFNSLAGIKKLKFQNSRSDPKKCSIYYIL